MHRRHGFTLIEVLAVLGIISILSAIVIPRFTRVRERAIVSVMQGDLHQLRFAQEVYNVEPEGVYASSLDELGDAFSPSEDVSVTLTGGGQDYSAVATHPGTAVVCRYATTDNLLTCEGGGGEKK